MRLRRNLRQADLRNNAGHYTPRACDCSFCVKHGAAYLSDAQGRLTIRAENLDSLRHYRQGSRNADCLFCGTCGVLVALVCHIDGRLHGTINSRILNDVQSFAEPAKVSPKSLTVQDKLMRWKQMWFSDVVVELG